MFFNLSACILLDKLNFNCLTTRKIRLHGRKVGMRLWQNDSDPSDTDPGICTLLGYRITIMISLKCTYFFKIGYVRLFTNWHYRPALPVAYGSAPR